MGGSTIRGAPTKAAAVRARIGDGQLTDRRTLLLWDDGVERADRESLRQDLDCDTSDRRTRLSSSPRRKRAPRTVTVDCTRWRGNRIQDWGRAIRNS